ncbi:hypothetical protein ACIQW5_21335 [Methylorubrum thiocyanatum]|uniref:hypothetical protein n=1 Tax=Methylorubrum thiocyanatum TaxID=47958 RepID=UPI00383BB703
MSKRSSGSDALRVIAGNSGGFDPPDAIRPRHAPSPAAEVPPAECVPTRIEDFDGAASSSPGHRRHESGTTGAIHILPCAPDLSQAAVDVLKRSIESGQDLGSRRHHIRMLEASLAVAQAEVRRRAELIRSLGPDLGVDLDGLYQEFIHYADSVGRLSSALLSNFPESPDDEEPPAGRG